MAELTRTNLVRPVPTAREVYVCIVIRDHEERKSRRDFFDHIDCPISQDSVDGAAPRAAELLTPTKGQVINYAGSEIMIELNLRQCPVCFCRSGKRIICGAGARAKIVRESTVEIPGIRITQQGVKPMSRTLGLRLDLERIVSSRTCILEVEDERVLVWGICRRRCAQATAQSVIGDRTTCIGRGYVQVHPVDQNMCAVRPRITEREENIGR